MNAEIRRKLEMGIRALEFSRAHPDASAGFATAMARLEERITRAEGLATQERAGVITERAATARKRELRRVLKRTLLNHLTRVAVVAAREEPELARKFGFPLGNHSYHAFRTAARAMADEAQAQKDLLVRHGLAEPVLEGLAQSLTDLDEAMDQSTAGRRAHIGAGAELAAVVGEMVQLVHVMDGINRFRFSTDAEKLAEWESARNVLGPIRSNGEHEGDGGETSVEVKPAA
jgi:hypothetical protein